MNNMLRNANGRLHYFPYFCTCCVILTFSKLYCLPVKMNSKSEENHVSEEILEMAESALDELIPTKSRKIYEYVYSAYVNWKTSKGITDTSEKVLLAYFKMLSNEYKPAILWGNFSMLKLMIKLKEKIDINKFTEISAFLKQKSKGYTAKKSKIFSANELESFLKNAPDEHELDKTVK